MAKEPKTKRSLLPAHLRKPVMMGLGALLLLFGVLLLWQGWRAMSQDALAPRLQTLRDGLVKQIDEAIAAQRGRFGAAVADTYVQADLTAGANEDAAKRVRESWPELAAMEFFDPELDAPFAGDLNAFGYSRLALLNTAQAQTETVADVVGRGADQLGLATQVRDGEKLLAIAYGAVPIADLVKVVSSAAVPSGGYLELRTGQRSLAENGDVELKPAAGVGMPVPGTSLQIASAAPSAEAMFAFSPVVLLGLGLVALLAGAALVVVGRRDVAISASEVHEATLADALEATPAPVPVAAKPKTKPVVAPPVPTNVDRSIFRAYDIRGVVGKTLDDGVARLIGQAVGTVMREKGLKEIVVGRDGRLSGPALSTALIEGLRRSGRDVIDIGLAPTPLVYFGTFHLGTGTGIALTGSHNPPDYNGFKIVVGGETLSGKAIEDLYVRIAENRLDDGGGGGLQTTTITDDYIERVSGDIQLERKLKVVVDAGNGVAGMLAPATLEAIGAEVVPLYCDVDGEFPNHHPDPGDPLNLSDLISSVARFEADLGVAFDGDGDRLGVVTRRGEIVYPDRVLMLFAQDVLSRNPGASVIYDVKCTGHLAAQILRHGGSPIMWKTGHSLIKAKMKETEAELAGEMSGHFFFRERWFGFDDGIYSAARLLEIVASDGRDADEIFAEIPKGVSTPELKIEMAEGEHYAFIEKFVQQAKFEGAKIATIDGVRADWSDGWGLVRCSNTTPSLVLRFDADNADALTRIQNLFKAQLLALGPSLKLPF